MHLLGTAATAVFAFDRSATFLDTRSTACAAQGRLGLLAQALVSQSWAAVHLAMPTLAVSAGEEAARLAPETGQQRWGLAAELALATVAGERGDLDRAEALAARAEAVLLPMGAQPMLALVQFVRGRGAVAHHRYDEGFAYLRRVLDPHDVAYHPFVGAWALPDLIEAATHTGERDEAERYFRELESLSSAMTSSYLRAAERYARAIISDDEASFNAALSSDLRNWPCFHGRLLLNYGRWLRRNRRIAESRAPLRAARQSFDALGFDGLAETARQELRASGETSIRRTPDARDYLTAQELQIAEMAATGLSNREIGQRLYLSHRTVESHLFRIFPKLGISSRAQLRLALPEAPAGSEAQRAQGTRRNNRAVDAEGMPGGQLSVPQPAVASLVRRPERTKSSAVTSRAARGLQDGIGRLIRDTTVIPVEDFAEELAFGRRTCEQRHRRPKLHPHRPGRGCPARSRGPAR